MTTLYDFTVNDNQNTPVSLEKYKGKVVLVVNTATHCGLTKQYEPLQKLYETYQAQGLEILDFPCNQFLSQAPEDDAGIQSFCETNYGTTFPRFAKIEVNGANTAPLYVWLKQTLPEDGKDSTFAKFLEKLASLGQAREGSDIKWNFTKFLINREGVPVARFAPSASPETFSAEVAALL